MPEEERKADTHRCPRACRPFTFIRVLTALVQLAVTVWNCTT